MLCLSREQYAQYNRYIDREVERIIELRIPGKTHKWGPRALVPDFIEFIVESVDPEKEFCMKLSARLQNGASLGPCPSTPDEHGLTIRLSKRQQGLYVPKVGDIIKWTPAPTIAHQEPMITVYGAINSTEYITIDLNDYSTMDIICG